MATLGISPTPSHLAQPEYVRFVSGGYEEARPVLVGAAAKPTFESIPMIDFSALVSGGQAEKARLVEDVRRAASEVGFFYAVNTPVPPALMDAAFSVITDFFNNHTEEEKMSVHIYNSPAAKGYFNSSAENGPTIHRESFTMGRDYMDAEQHHLGVAPAGSRHLNQWPDAFAPKFRETIYEYHNELHRFSMQLLHVFALALGLSETGLDGFFKNPLTDITIQHYPKQESLKTKEVLRPHADHSAFTILLQNRVPSLQVLNANAIWVDAPPIDHAFVINTGNYMENWSNGLFPSTVHRVYTETGAERFSLPFFLNPDPSCVVEPLTQCIKLGEVAKYDPWPIGSRSVKGLFASKKDHPYVARWAALGLRDEDLKYEMLYQPEPAEWSVGIGKGGATS